MTSPGGLSFFERLRLRVSARLVQRLLRHLPQDAALLQRMGLIRLALGENDAAIAAFEAARVTGGADPAVHYNLACALQAAGRGREALASYDRALALAPGLEEARTARQALAESQRAGRNAATRERQQAAQASRSARRAQGELGRQFEQARSLHAKGRTREAAAACERLLKADPGHAGALHLAGVLALQAGQHERAEGLIRAALERTPDDGDMQANLALALQGRGEYEAALAGYEQALALKPDSAEAWCNHGDILARLRRFEAALQSYERAIAINPKLAETHLNHAYALQALGRNRDALASLDQAIAMRPRFAEAHANRANALAQLRDWEGALAAHARALELKPDYAEGRANRGILLGRLGRNAEALPDLEHAWRLKPDHDFLLGNLIQCRLQLCHWEGLPALVSAWRAAVRRGERVALPFAALAVADAPALHREIARIWDASRAPEPDPLPPLPATPRKRGRGERIRIGYLSADFHRHATTYLMAGVFEQHDKSRFEIVAVSFDHEPPDEMRARVAAACDRFVEVQHLGDRDAAALCRELQLDIAVDLKGYTGEARAGILAQRVAPVQASYLGYPGTLGVDYMDYVIADATVLPAAQFAHYSEQVVWLPHSYQCNDRARSIAGRAFARADFGLPEAGFVFCCFCNSFKINAALFDIWMRLLAAVEGSVLWLIDDNPAATANLRKEAATRGIDPARLVFSGRMPLPEHLARHRLADLFLDTFPYGAHTTGSDALWAGLPVLTCAGESFASRVAASLLHAVGMPELVTTSQSAYEALAIELAADPGRLQALRQRLADTRLGAPLFDTPCFTRHLEEAYRQMHERSQAGQAPGSIVVRD